jgi:hypothetical protein
LFIPLFLFIFIFNNKENAMNNSTSPGLAPAGDPLSLTQRKWAKKQPSNSVLSLEVRKGTKLGRKLPRPSNSRALFAHFQWTPLMGKNTNKNTHV